MRCTQRPRRRASALYAAVLVIVLLFGFTAAMVGLSTHDARGLVATERMRRAFFYAEAGVEAAKFEITANEDPDGDGRGNRTVVGSDWSYSVVATPLPNRRWRLAASGVCRGEHTTVHTVVTQEVTSSFPGGAISIVGDIDKTRFRIRKDSSVFIDGGENPAIAVTDDATFQDIARSFAEAIEEGRMPAGNLSGAVSNHFDLRGNLLEEDAPGSLELSIDRSYTAPVDLQEISALYAETVQTVNDRLLPSATVVESLDADHVTFGSPEKPAVVYLPDLKTRLKGQSLQGHGTLIVNELVIDHGGQLDWTGDIIIIGNHEKKARLEVHHDSSSFHVDGNVLLLGEATEPAELRVHGDASVTVNGSLFVATEYAEGRGQRARLRVDTGGRLDVEGVLTLAGRRVEAEFQEGTTVNISGTLQIAVPEGRREERLRFDLRGDLLIRRDNDAIAGAAESWEDLGVRLDIPTAAALIDTAEFSTESWRRSYE